MWTLELLVQIISGVIATVAFAILFKLRARYLAYAALGGGITYFIYYAIDFEIGVLFAAAFFASVFSALYSEVCARIKQAPTTLFLFPCAISIVPGGSLYRTMVSLISQDFAGAWGHFGDTLSVAMGIAGGLIFVSLVFYIVTGVVNHIRLQLGAKKHQNNENK